MPGDPPAEPSTEPAAAVRLQLARILQSPGFSHSRQLSRFLTYIVSETLAGQSDLIKEYVLAIDVFGREKTFDAMADAIVRVQAKKLRSRLAAYYENEGLHDPVRIEVPRGSYMPRFLPNSTGNGVAAVPDTVVAAPPEGKPHAGLLHRRWPRAAGLAVLLCIASSVSYHLGSSRTEGSREAASIAVLPFIATGPESADYFADGLTEEVISSLGRIPELRTVARTSVFQYKGKEQDVRRIGAELGVKRILEGSVRQHAGAMRVNVQLVDAVSGYQIWTADYDRPGGDIVQLQNTIAADIARFLRFRLNERIRESHPPRDSLAYDSYLQGRYYWHQRTSASLEAARDYFQQAIRRDPHYAAAYAGLADTYAQLAAYELAPVDRVAGDALAAARRAVELDANSAETQTSMGYALAAFTFDWEGAEASFRRAIRLNPGHADAHRWLGSLALAMTGRLDEAIQEIRIAAQYDPVSVFVYHDLGKIHSLRGEYDAAATEYEQALRIDPSHARTYAELAFCHEQLGDPHRALTEFEKAVEVSGRHPAYLADLARFYAATGRRARALALLSQIKSSAGPYHLAAIYGQLGDRDAAFEKLNEAVATGLAPRVLLARYAPLSQDPRYEAFLRRIRYRAGSGRATPPLIAPLMPMPKARS